MVRTAVAKATPAKLAPCSDAPGPTKKPESFAQPVGKNRGVPTTADEVTPVIVVPVKFALVTVAPVKFAFIMLTLVKFALVKFALVKLTE